MSVSDRWQPTDNQTNFFTNLTVEHAEVFITDSTGTTVETLTNVKGFDFKVNC